MWPPPLCTLEEAPGPLDTSNWIIRPHRMDDASSPSPSPSPSSSLTPPQLTSLPGPGLIAGSHPGSIDPHENELTLQTLVRSARVTVFINLLANELMSFTSYEERATEIAAAAHRTVQFMSCPIRDGHTAGDEAVLALCLSIVRLLREQHIVYVHCWGGHGRTGTVVSIVIGLVYGMSGEEALAACAERHERRTINKGISSPQSPAQCRQVVRILAHIQTGSPLQTAAGAADAAELRAALSVDPAAPPLLARSMLPVISSYASAYARQPPSPTASFSFTVMTWNTLASSLCSSVSFPYAPAAALSLSNRRALFVQELRRCSPSIICLQEVDRADYDAFFLPLLSSLHYDALYSKKPSADSQDGSAFFYSTATFAMLSYSATPLLPSPPQSEQWNKTCIVSQLAPILDDAVLTSQRLVVAVCHLKAKQENAAVRLRQIACVLHRVEETVARLRSVGGELNVNVIVCGDMNDTPASPLHAFVCSGQLQRVLHPFWLHSLYDRYYSSDVYWTTCKRREALVQRVIDFIFFSPLGLLPTELLSIPLPCELPNLQYPSDHLALVGKFRLVSQRTHHAPVAAIARHKL